MTKKLNTDHIRSELADSVFFRAPRPPAAPPDPAPPAPDPAQIPPLPPVPATPEREHGRTGERASSRRIITRNSFEIYEDQMQSLRTRAYQERMAGKLGSMSRMVREAIDRYLKETPPRTLTNLHRPERVNGRTCGRTLARADGTSQTAVILLILTV